MLCKARVFYSFCCFRIAVAESQGTLRIQTASDPGETNCTVKSPALSLLNAGLGKHIYARAKSKGAVMAVTFGWEYAQLVGGFCVML